MDHRDDDAYVTSWEQQCINQLEEEEDLEGQLTTEKETVSHNLWCSFQNTATAIAQLYKDRVQDAGSLWVPFQAAAGTVTTMFKDSGEGAKKLSDLGVHCGYQRRNKELLQWARKKRRNIRREDLIAYLAGKPPPPRTQGHHHRSSPRPRINFGGATSHSLHSAPLLHASEVVNVEENLKIFGEAINNRESMRRQRACDLNTFFASEYARHVFKRAASSSPPRDVNMDSPTHKRSRHF